MNPNPLLELNHLTVPCSLMSSPRDCAMGASPESKRAASADLQPFMNSGDASAWSHALGVSSTHWSLSRLVPRGFLCGRLCLSLLANLLKSVTFTHNFSPLLNSKT